jgi:hypothetical protein
MVEDTDLNFVRAMDMLENKIDSPKYLIAFWRAIGNIGDLDAPMPEIVKPWWRGLEDVIHMR